MSKHPFLSDDWIAAAHAVRDEHAANVPTPPPIRMNLVVTAVPFGKGTIEAHIDSTTGRLDLEHGHIDAPDVSISTDYDTAKALFVEQNQQAALSAFMAGKVRVQGDLTKLMALQPPTSAVDADGDLAQSIGQRIKDITE
jgi:SCP-2 sterol transfer family